MKAEYTAAQRAFSAEYQKAKTDEERSAVVTAKMPKATDWFTRMKAIADRVPGDEAAGEALLWIAGNSGPGDANHAAAVKTLLTNHRKGKGAAQLCNLLARETTAEAEAALRDLAKSSDQRDVRAQATYSLASQRKTLASQAESLKAAGSEDAKWVAESLGEDGAARVKALDPAALRAEGEALLDRIVAEFADCKTSRKATFGEMASAELFEMRNLAIGKVAPEIAGEDLNGEQMSLAAFRGKVVVLDFWGNW